MLALKKFFHKKIKPLIPAVVYQIKDDRYFHSLKRKPPELMWQALPRGPRVRYDAGGIQVGHLLYAIAGYEENADSVYNDLDIFDLRKCRWIEHMETPREMAQSHLGIACENNRYIYIISGQCGNQCHPPTQNCFVLDTQTKEWHSFPALPKARYAPVAAILRGRLHVLGGSQEDRNTPSVDHWSIAVKDGKALEENWQTEPACPRGGPHGASAVIDDKLYLFGGQEGDYIAIPGNPRYICTGKLTNENIYPDTYVLEPGKNDWKRLSDMPIKVSHSECATLNIGGKVLVVGGMVNKDPKTRVVELTDAIQCYDVSKDKWHIIGRLPFGLKTTFAAYYEGWLYVTTGQRSKSAQDMTTGLCINQIWRARISLS